MLSCNFTLHESKHMMLLHDSTKVQNRERETIYFHKKDIAWQWPVDLLFHVLSLEWVASAFGLSAVAVVKWQCSAMTHIGALCDVARFNAEASERRCSAWSHFYKATFGLESPDVFHSMWKLALHLQEWLTAQWWLKLIIITLRKTKISCSARVSYCYDSCGMCSHRHT